MIMKAADLGQADPIALEPHEIVEALGVASQAQLHPRDLTASCF